MKEDTTQVDATWLEKTGGYAKDMTLVDHFAGQIIVALINCPNWRKQIDEDKVKNPAEFTAIAAWHMAEAMLKERSK